MTTIAYTTKTNKGLNIALWTVQVILMALFLFSGFLKSMTPIDELAVKMPWVLDFSVPMVRFIGITELLGALGMILPSALRIAPKLTPWAATGLLTVMVIASIYHIAKGEAHVIGTPLVIGAMALFVAWGRFKKVPIQPKNV